MAMDVALDWLGLMEGHGDRGCLTCLLLAWTIFFWGGGPVSWSVSRGVYAGMAVLDGC